MAVAVAASVLAWPSWVWAQEAGEPEGVSVGSVLVRTFPREEHGGYFQNFALAQDRRGLIYATNASGLLQYDGERWEIYELPTFLSALEIDDQDRIWLAGDNHIGRMVETETGELVYESLIDLLSEEERKFSHVWPVFASNEDVFFIAREFLLRYRNGEITSWPAADPSQIFYRAYEIHGRLYFAQWDVGLVRLRADDTLEVVAGGAFGNGEELNAMWETPDGGGWLLTRRDGAYRFDGEKLEPYESPLTRWLDRASVQHGNPVDAEIYAIATINNGIALVDGGLNLLRRIDSKNGLSDDKVHFVMTDRDGHLWAGTDTAIDRVVLGSGLARYDTADGLEGRVYSLVEHEGRLVVGTSRGVFQARRTMTGLRFDRIPGVEGAGWSFLSVDDTLLVAVGDGVYGVRFGGSGGIELTTADRLTDERIIYLFRSAHFEDVIFGSFDSGVGVLKRQQGQWRWQGPWVRLLGEVRAALDGPDGEILVNITGQNRIGVLEFPGGLDGEPLFHDFPERPGFFHKLDGEIYYSEDGLWQRYLGKAAAAEGWPFESTEALADIASLADGPFSIETEAENGELWIETAKGLRILENRTGSDPSLRRLASRPLTEVEAVVLDDPQGSAAWIGTSDGLYRYQKKERTERRSRFETSMRRVVVRDRAGNERNLGGLGRSGSGSMPILPYSENRLRFEFAAPAYDQVEEVLYQTRLDGQDVDWSPWKPEAFEDYTNLPEGSYDFRVRASNISGQISSEASYRFRVLSPWYRTGWAYSAAFVLAIGLVLALIRVRTANLIRIRRRLEEQVAERTQELADEKSQVEAQARDLEIVNRKLAEENSHRRQLEGERSKLEARLEQSNKLESLGQMAGGIAHDFNNILMAVLGNTDLALEDSELSAEAHSRLRDIRLASERAAELCRQMLVYAGKGRFDERELDPNVVVEETLSVIRPNLPDRIDLDTRLADGLPAIAGDAAQLRQVIAHLVSNAVEALQGPGTVRVETGARHLDRDFFQHALLAEAGLEGRHVFLRVADDGSGMSEDVRRRIFDPFFTTKFTGRGLGLAATLGIVRSHGGTLTVESEVDVGTTVEVFLPALDHPMGETREPSTDEIRQWRRTGKVLVVDDESIVREVVALMLRNIGFEVETAADGVDGIEYYSRHHEELAAVVLDLTMPGLDGVETFERMHSIDDRVPVILSSGYGAEDLKDRYLEIGFAAFVHKPYETSALRAVLKRVLESSDGLGEQELE